MQLWGVGVRGYRSFGAPEVQYVAPLSGILAIAGQNNVGKSNALAVLHELLPRLGSRSPDLLPSGYDRPRGWPEDELFYFEIGVKLTADDLATMRIESGDLVERFLGSPEFHPTGDDSIWIRYEYAANSSRFEASETQFDAALGRSNNDTRLAISALSTNFTSTSGPEISDWRRILEHWNIASAVPVVRYLPAMRAIASASDGSETSQYLSQPQFSDLINQFADFQAPSNPDTRDWQEGKWNDLQHFLRSVLQDPDARFGVAGDRQRVFVRSRNGEMELARLGTGIEEVLILAAAATFSTGAIVCVEEPELHLHPALQRQLMSYLASLEDTVFVLSTHSPAVLNAPEPVILQASMEQGHTRLVRAISSQERANLAHILGARASDVVQTNYIIWVEGPSDRTYLLAWIRLVDPSLLEGVHFAIVFYGGRLLSHLAFNDQEVSDLIQLQSVCRNYGVVIDSDKTRAHQTINATKQRVVDEAASVGAFSWVTDGREIENYVSKHSIEAAIDQAYPHKSFAVGEGKWGDRLGGDFDGAKTGPSKVIIAGLVASRWGETDWQLDCLSQVNTLVGRIRVANDLTP